MMTSVRSNVDANRDVLGAVEWFMRPIMEGPQRPAEEQVAWEKWLADPDHTLELAHVEEVWDALGDPAAIERLAAPSSRAACAGVSEIRTRRTVATTKTFAIAASLFLLVAFGLLRFAPQSYQWFMSAAPAQTYSTDSAERKFVTLPDGSRITLGASTKLSVHYSLSHRTIWLERGEALFSVAHSPTRPFVVLAGAGSITAIGTQFEVRRERDEVDRVTVTVSEGTVEVQAPKRPDPKAAPVSGVSTSPTLVPTRIVKGQELSYDQAGPQGGVAAVDVGASSAWTEGRLEYRHTPLRVVIPRVSRYNEKPIVVADDAAGELPFSGIIFVGQIDEFLRALQAAYPVEVLENADQFVIHSRADATSR